MVLNWNKKKNWKKFCLWILRRFIPDGCMYGNNVENGNGMPVPQAIYIKKIKNKIEQFEYSNDAATRIQCYGSTHQQCTPRNSHEYMRITIWNWVWKLLHGARVPVLLESQKFYFWLETFLARANFKRRSHIHTRVRYQNFSTHTHMSNLLTIIGRLSVCGVCVRINIWSDIFNSDNNNCV